MLTKEFSNLEIFIRLRRFLRNFPFEKDKIRSLQFKKLKKILVHSYENFEFYKNLMAGVRFDPHKFQDLKEIEKLPIIDREMYREFTQNILKKNPRLEEQYFADVTSGSSGSPITVYRTKAEQAYTAVKFLRILILNGYKLFFKTLGIMDPQTIVARDSLLQKFGILRRCCVPYSESPQNLVRNYLEVEPDILYGNKSQIVQMAQHIAENDIDIKLPRLYVSAGEVLDVHSQEIMKNVFGPNLIQIYGAVEFGNLAFQIKGHQHIHFNHDTNILELDDNGHINDVRGYSIVTDLHVLSFPLIRYRLGDWIETSQENDIRVIKQIQGRMDDWLKFRDGTRVPVQKIWAIMDKYSGIKQYRYVQKSYDSVRVIVALRNEVNREEFEEKLKRDLISEINKTIDYQIEFVSKIEPDRTGKLRCIISEVL